MSEKLAPTPASRSRGPRRPFVGRQAELDELSAALDEAAQGQGRVYLLSGEPGIGKTRLIQELTREAGERGWQVAAGRCWEEGGAPAYWPWIQTVRALGGDFERLVTGGGESVEPETVRFRLFDRAARFLIEAAQPRPLLIVLEDLHAADSPSLVLLRFLGDAIADAPVLVVGSYREREARQHEQPESFDELARMATRLPLRGLSVDGVGTYVAGTTGADPAPAVSARLQALTGGNPFFLGEVVRLLAHDGLADGDEALGRMGPVPEEVRTLLRRRMADLPPEAVEAVQVAAVIGREFDLRVLERTSALDVGRLLEVLDGAEAAGVLSEDPVFPRRYAFVHELVRETLYDDLSPARRLELHRVIGGVLEELYRHDPEPHLSEIARHFALAAPLGNASDAIEYLVRAGDRAGSVLAYEEAGTHYERALGLLGATEEAARERRCEMLLRLGDARWRAGDTRAARASFEEAVELARRLGDGERLARAANGYVVGLGGFLLFARFEVGGTGAGLLEEALAALPPEDSPLRAQVHARLAVEMYFSNDVERRLALSAEAVEMSRRLHDSEGLVTALHARHWALGAPEMLHVRLENTEEMLAVAAELGNQELAFLAHNSRFHCFLELCDGTGLDAEIAAMIELAERIQQPFYRWHAVCVQVIRATLDGRMADAERLAGEALQIARLRHSEYASYVYEYAQMVAIRWAQGRLSELLPEVADHGERYLWVPRWRDALAAAESADRRAAAAEIARHAGSGFADIRRDGFFLLSLSSLADACVLVGDTSRGRRIYELLLPFADRNTVSLTLQPHGPVALRLGMLAAMLERWEEAEEHFETALGRCDLLGARAFRPRVLLEQARVLIARGGDGDRERAGALLEDARSTAEDLGLQGVLERIGSLETAAEPPAAPTERPEARFRREGDFWTIAYEGRTFRLRDVKGLRYIAELLRSPGSEIHVLELASALGPAPDGAVRADASGNGLHASRPGDAGPLIDARAREEYRSRLEELRADLDEAQRFGDPERAAGLEAEVDTLVAELARAAGLGGRERPTASPAERARVSVTKAIRTAIRLIEGESPALAEHLGASISTGRFCCYAPPGERPPTWDL
jgi:tetratricopeptide (TPR) repeat protein